MQLLDMLAEVVSTRPKFALFRAMWGCAYVMLATRDVVFTTFMSHQIICRGEACFPRAVWDIALERLLVAKLVLPGRCQLSLS